MFTSIWWHGKWTLNGSLTRSLRVRCRKKSLTESQESTAAIWEPLGSTNKLFGETCNNSKGLKTLFKFHEPSSFEGLLPIVLRRIHLCMSWHKWSTRILKRRAKLCCCHEDYHLEIRDLHGQTTVRKCFSMIDGYDKRIGTSTESLCNNGWVSGVNSRRQTWV